jgi:DNA-binding CsgD family transcriptional regulator
MSLAPSHHDATSVYVVGPDSVVRNAVARLLEVDPGIAVLGTTDVLDPRAPLANVVIDESLLHDLRDLSVSDFIAMVKSLGIAPAPSVRHLRPVPNGNDMRSLLSERELQVVRLVAEGLSNKEISIRLKLSDKTVKNHISHILAKMQLTARTQVAVNALRAGIV